MSDLPSLSVNGQSQQLNEDEASELAKELKQQLRNGEVPAADGESIERMVAGLGDPRGLMRLTFAESLGVVGKAAVPSLCRALAEHESVTVRRAAAKTLTLIEDPRALPVLQKALLQDPDPVVQGSAVGAMAAVGEEAIDGMLEILINPSSTAMQLGLASWGLAFVGARAGGAAQGRHIGACGNSLRRCALGDQALGDDSARELVENALTDAETDVRAEAATLLGKLHSPDWAVPRLEPLLSDPQGQVRKNAALSLMKLQAAGSIASLSQQLEREQQADVKAVLQLAINQLDQDG